MTSTLQQFLARYSVTETVADLILLHSVAVAFSHLPYENVTKILKEAASVSSGGKLRRMEEVLSDHLRWNTGGTCFSLCNALQQVLEGCGFSAFVAMGDMHYGKNIHCAVVVNMQDRNYLLDPGYLLHEPIPLPTNGLEVSRVTPMNTVIIRSESPSIYSLYTREQGIEKWRYRLRTVSVSREEFERHWMHSFSLNSMENVTLIRMTDRGRLYYRKDRLELVNHAQRHREKPSGTAELSEVFGIPSEMLQKANLILVGR